MVGKGFCNPAQDYSDQIFFEKYFILWEVLVAGRHSWGWEIRLGRKREKIGDLKYTSGTALTNDWLCMIRERRMCHELLLDFCLEQFVKSEVTFIELGTLEVARYRQG